MGYLDINFDENDLFLVTGGAGFIGSNLCEALLDKGVKVRCLDNLSTGFYHNIEKFLENPNFEFIKGSIINKQDCEEACKNVDYVLHQAAWGSVPRSIKMPLYYEEVNIKGTLNMMSSAKDAGVKKFVYASSSSVYGDSAVLPKVEGQEGNVLSPYALTKKVAEEYGRLFHQIYDLDTYGLRYFNVFGRRQNTEGDYAAVIPKFTKQLLNNEIPTINGDGQQSRDFTYIENVIEANLKACKADSSAAGHSYNIAFGGRERLIDVYNRIAEAVNSDIIPKYGEPRAGDVRHSNAQIDKAMTAFGYNPDWDFASGINEAIEWYVENL